jgi:hypothetical protein
MEGIRWPFWNIARDKAEISRYDDAIETHKYWHMDKDISLTHTDESLLSVCIISMIRMLISPIICLSIV